MNSRAMPPKAPPPPTDRELNLAWVFSQLTQLDAPVDDGRKKRNSVEAALEAAAPPTITAKHVQHVFEWMKVPLTADEAEEVINLLDDNQDGRVTLDDFWNTMKVTTSTPFDPRYALNLPFASLDSTTRDGLITDEDYRNARSGLGRMFGCDSDMEFNTIMRAMHSQSAQEPSTGVTPGVASSPGMAAIPVPAPSPSIGTASPRQRAMDRALLQRIVGASGVRLHDSPAVTPAVSMRTLRPSASASSAAVASASVAASSSFASADPANPPSIVISLTPASPSPYSSSANNVAMPSYALTELVLDDSSTPQPPADSSRPPSSFSAVAPSPSSTAFPLPHPPQSARAYATPRKGRSSVDAAAGSRTTTNAASRSARKPPPPAAAKR